jgi:uncharacterized protein YbjT (DUF2867 family)
VSARQLRLFETEVRSILKGQRPERVYVLYFDAVVHKVEICALGTTSGKAGSKEAFRQVDYVIPLAFAKLALQQGAETFALVSAIGADANSSFFYPKTKGEVERDMKLVGFKSLTILRPSIIGGKRGESRFAEGLALTLSRILAPVLPNKFHVNPAAKIAGVLLDSVIAAVPGCHYRYAESLT